MQDGGLHGSIFGKWTHASRRPAWVLPTLRFCVVQPCRAFFAEEHISLTEILFYDFAMVFEQRGPNLLFTRGPTIKTGILTLIKFWWVP